MDSWSSAHKELLLLKIILLHRIVASQHVGVASSSWLALPDHSRRRPAVTLPWIEGLQMADDLGISAERCFFFFEDLRFLPSGLDSCQRFAPATLPPKILG